MLKKPILESDNELRTHFKAAHNYLVSPKGQMLSDQILNHGEINVYSKQSIGMALDDEKVAKFSKKLTE